MTLVKQQSKLYPVPHFSGDTRRRTRQICRHQPAAVGGALALPAVDHVGAAQASGGQTAATDDDDDRDPDAEAAEGHSTTNN